MFLSIYNCAWKPVFLKSGHIFHVDVMEINTLIEHTLISASWRARFYKQLQHRLLQLQVNLTYFVNMLPTLTTECDIQQTLLLDIKFLTEYLKCYHTVEVISY